MDREQKNLTTTIGIDIGGANLKLSDGANYSRHEPFALWQKPDQLQQTITSLFSDAPEHQHVAVTMTGELSDCFDNKRQGVNFICDAIESATSVPVHVYLLDGRFVDLDTARKEYLLAAASNWHALANQVANSICKNEQGLLIDIGSTTTDVIPFINGRVVTQGIDDFGRLANHELVYTAAIRSSLAGILNRVTHRGTVCPLMNENFASTLDTNIILGHIAAGTNRHYASDDQPTELIDCARRISRLIGKDDLTFDLNDAKEFAKQIYKKQVTMIARACTEVLQGIESNKLSIVTSGQGEFLARSVASSVAQSIVESDSVKNVSHVSHVKLVSLAGEIGSKQSDCATAWSIANLHQQEFNVDPIIRTAETQ